MGWYGSWGDLLFPQLYFKHPPSWTVGLWLRFHPVFCICRLNIQLYIYLAAIHHIWEIPYCSKLCAALGQALTNLAWLWAKNGGYAGGVRFRRLFFHCIHCPKCTYVTLVFTYAKEQMEIVRIFQFTQAVAITFLKVIFRYVQFWCILGHGDMLTNFYNQNDVNNFC